MKSKKLIVYLSAIILTLTTSTIGATEMNKAPIDTIFAQGEKILMDNFLPDKLI